MFLISPGRTPGGPSWVDDVPGSSRGRELNTETPSAPNYFDLNSINTELKLKMIQFSVNSFLVSYDEFEDFRRTVQETMHNLLAHAKYKKENSIK